MKMFGLGKIILLAHLSLGCQINLRHKESMTKTSSSANASTKGALLTDLHIKVPAVTAFFWIIKVLATTVGETLADFLENMDPGGEESDPDGTFLTMVA